MRALTTAHAKTQRRQEENEASGFQSIFVSSAPINSVPINLYDVWIKLILIGAILVIGISACGGDGGGAAPTSSDPLMAEGEEVFEKNCARCHSFEEGKVIVGPSLFGVASRAGTRMEGLSAEEYIHLSITKPSAYLADDFNDLMPTNFQALLSPDELEAVIAYLLTHE